MGELMEKVLAPTGLRPELFLVDHEQIELRPLPPGAGPPVRVDGTLPGRAYQLGTVFDGTDDDGAPVLWVPFVDGVERLGVVRMQLPLGADPGDRELQER
jgi:hypothetical protein